MCLCLFGGFFFVLCSDLLSSFPRDFLLLPLSGVLSGSCLLFFFLTFFCRLSRFLSRVVPSSFLEGRSGLGLMSSVLPWVLWTLLLALGRFVLLSLHGPLAVQLRFFLCMWFRQTLGVSSLRRSLWWSAGCSVPRTFYWCCGILSLPYQSLWALGRGFLILSSFFRLQVPFYGFFRQLAAIGVLFVVFILVVAWPVRFCAPVPRSFLFLFLWMYAGGLVVLSLWAPCEFSFVFCGSCSFLSTFVFSSFLCLPFPMAAESYFAVGLSLRAAVFSFLCLSCSRSFCFSYPKVRFLFQGAWADFCFLLCCCGNIVNPSSFSLGVFLIPGICLRLRFFILQYFFLVTLATLGNFLFWFLVSLVRLVRMWVLSPLPPSFPCVSVLFLACYLAAMPLPWLTHDTRQWTVSFRPHLLLWALWSWKSFGYTPSVCLATGIVNLYTVIGLPASSGWTAVPQGSSVLAC